MSTASSALARRIEPAGDSALARPGASAADSALVRRGAPLAAAVSAIALLELITRADTGLLPERVFPPPSAIVKAARSELLTGAFWDALGGTLAAWSAGVACAVAVAVPLGLLIGSCPWGWQSTRLLVDMLRPVPALAVLPLLLLLIGLSIRLTIVVAALGAVWPLLIQTIAGVRSVDPVTAEMARAHGLGALARARHIVLPSAVPAIATGLRIAAVVALNVVIAEELVVGGANASLGASIGLAQTAGRFDRMYVFVVVTGLLGVASNLALRRIERQLAHWRPQGPAGAWA